MDSNRRSFQTAVITVSAVDLEISKRFNLDRYAGDVLVLPYDFDEIRIKSNDLCIADNINASLAKLHNNFLYLNANTKLADNNFPQRYKGFMASTSGTSFGGVGWYSAAQQSTDIVAQLTEVSQTSTTLSGVVAGDFAKPDYSPSEYFGVIAMESSLIGVRSSYTDTTPDIDDNIVILNKTTVEDASGLTFNNIRAVKFNSKFQLVVADGVSVHVLDICPVLTSNRALSSIGRFLISTIGGKSRDIYDKDKFNKPVSIAIGNNDTVYILDQDDHGIKKYDSDLNWLQTSARKNQYTALDGGKVVSIEVDKSNDYVYVLSDNGVLFEYDDTLAHTQTITFTDPVKTDEKFKQIVFSNKDSSVMYILTTDSVYKKFKTRLDKSIGAFRLLSNNITSTESFSFCSVMETDDKKYDYVFVGSNSTHGTMTTTIGKIYKFDESISYKTVSDDSYKTDLLALSSINVKGVEFVTDLTINKAINKMMFNHLRFRDSFLMKYVAAYDSIGRVELTSVDYLTDTDYNLFSYEMTQEHHIGINEPVFADNVNRPLRKIYDFQNQLVTMCAETITNKFPYATQVIELK